MGARGKGGSGVGRWVHPDVWALLPSHIAVEACRLLVPKARIVLKYWQYPPKKGVLCIQQATDNRSEAIVARIFVKSSDQVLKECFSRSSGSIEALPLAAGNLPSLATWVG